MVADGQEPPPRFAGPPPRRRTSSHNVTAPLASRRPVNDPASMSPPPSPARVKRELAAKPVNAAATIRATRTGVAYAVMLHRPWQAAFKPPSCRIGPGSVSGLHPFEAAGCEAGQDRAREHERHEHERACPCLAMEVV